LNSFSLVAGIDDGIGQFQGAVAAQLAQWVETAQRAPAASAAFRTTGDLCLGIGMETR
jgi:hypothetical protein